MVAFPHIPHAGAPGNWLIVDADGQTSPVIDTVPLSNMLARTVRFCQQRTDAKGRKLWNLHQVAERQRNAWLQRQDAQAQEQAGLLRGDAAFDPSAGFYDIQDLTHKFEDVIREERRPLEASRIFQTNTMVKPGALYYQQTRLMSTAQAVVYRGGNGSDIPTAGVAQVRQTAGVVYLASKASIDLMQAMTDSFTGFDTLDEKMDAATVAILQLENDWTFFGSPENNLLGLFNHPFIDTYVSGVRYNLDTAPDDLIDDLGMWGRYNRKRSKGAFQVDTVTISAELHGILTNRPRSTGSDLSVWAWFILNNPHITNVEIIDQFDDAGGEGVHAMVFMRKGGGLRDTSAQIIKPTGITILPADQRALGTDMYLLSGYGGLNTRKVGDMLIVYANTNTN